MATFRFEIQNCINIEIEADDVDSARLELLDNIRDYAYDFIDDAYVSDGVEVKE